MNSLGPLTRQDALRSWEQFLPKVLSYSNARNHVQHGHANVSRLSAAIRFRTLLEDEIIEDTLKLHAFEPAQKWLQEVCWRRYWKGWMEVHPDVWANWRRQLRVLREMLPAETLQRAEQVAAGRSGVACMDKIARELVDTGYLHNHARMWWASFWIHVEQLPWELGADFFFRHLLDADPASNTLSWRWVAGIQTQGKTYLVRRSNIEKYAPSYLTDNEAGAARIADDAVSARPVQHPANVRRALPVCATDYKPSGERTGLWLHADDLSPEIGPLADAAPACVAACVCEQVYEAVYGLSRSRVDALRLVIGDGADRAAAHYRCKAEVLEADDPVQSLLAWALANTLSEVVALMPFVGPVGDMLPRLRRNFEAAGVRLTLVRRPSDQVAFSMATAGFFPFWQKMSDCLRLRQSQ